MENTKNEFAVGLGRKSWETRTKGMTEDQIKKMMSKLKKGKKKSVI